MPETSHAQLGSQRSRDSSLDLLSRCFPLAPGTLNGLGSLSGLPLSSCPTFPCAFNSESGRQQVCASKLVDSVPMVNARKARPIETTEILQKCVSFWRLHSQSFISSHCNQPITQDYFQGHYSGCGGCFCKQVLILLNVLPLKRSLGQTMSIKASFRKRKCKRSER